MFHSLVLLQFVALPWLVIGDHRIIGGNTESIKVAPWYGSLIAKSKLKCGGVLVKNNYFLTAAKCVDGFDVSDLQIRLGTSSCESGGSKVGVCKVKVHPQYSSWRFDNNLALLRTCEPLVATDEIKPKPQPPVGAPSCGGASLREPCETVSAYVLRKLDVNLHDPNSCSKDRKRWFNISSGDTVQNICVTRKTESCSFDKGAPMVIDGKLAGILALGDCSKEPEVFINLFHHKAWLESNSKDK
uniref:Trypsin-2-like n=1 Tax=Drosophila rhopaloa TaxID=1041015 RepID=A0A6P4FEM3_DRORH